MKIKELNIKKLVRLNDRINILYTSNRLGIVKVEGFVDDNAVFAIENDKSRKYSEWRVVTSINYSTDIDFAKVYNECVNVVLSYAI